MSTNLPYEEKELLMRFAAGDKIAFGQIFRQWYPRLVIFSEQYDYGRGDAEEIVSEAFLKAWQRRAQFEALPKLKSFLYTVVRNGSMDAIRRSRVREGLEQSFGLVDKPGVTEIFDEVEMMRAEVIGALYQAIEQLPERPREIVLLTYKEGLTSAQIAEQLQLTESTVRSHRARAIQLLKIVLADKYPLLILSLDMILKQLSDKN